jgi:hypothetical protein
MLILAFTIIESAFNMLDSGWIAIFVAFNAILLLAFFVLSNFSYFWYGSNYATDKERLNIHNFKNCEPDGAPTKTFTSKFEMNADIERLVDSNLDILRELSTDDFIAKSIRNYEERTGETFDLTPVEYEQNGEQKPLPVRKLRSGTRRKQRPVEIEVAEGGQATEQEVETSSQESPLTRAVFEAEKAVFLTILRKVFKGWHFSILYYHWDFLTPFVEETLSSYVKAYIFSLNSPLPTILNMNCALLHPEFENGKWMTALFCIEGPRDEQVLTRITNMANDLDSFVKPWPKIFEIEAIKRDRDWWKAYALSLEKGDYKMIKRFITLKTRRRKLMPDEQAEEEILRDVRKQHGEGVVLP